MFCLLFGQAVRRRERLPHRFSAQGKRDTLPASHNLIHFLLHFLMNTACLPFRAMSHLVYRATSKGKSNMGNNMTLRTKLALATGFLLIMLCGLGIFSLTQMNRINGVATEIVDEWLPATRYAMRLDTLASDFRHCGNPVISMLPTRKIKLDMKKS